MHAGWNLLIRRHRSEGAAFIERMLLVALLIGFVPTLLSEMHAHSIRPMAWVFVSGSGLCCGIYFFFLSKAYAVSDFTTVYPVARSLPVLLIALVEVFLGRLPSPMGWVGLMLVALGCLFSPLLTFRDITAHRYLNKASLWMLLTAVGTVGYTVFDKLASEIVIPDPGTAARYCYVFFFITCCFYAIFKRLFSANEGPAPTMGWKYPLLAASMCFGAYWLVLWAYQLSRHASYVVAFRQFSIVIGVIWAFRIYKEEGLWVRSTGTIMITVGLIIIAFWG